MIRSAAQARYDALHKEMPFHDGSFTTWAKERTSETPFEMNEGVTVGVADEDLHPWDDFTKKVDASPVPHEPPAGE